METEVVVGNSQNIMVIADGDQAINVSIIESTDAIEVTSDITGVKGDPGTTDYNDLTNKPSIPKAITISETAPATPVENDLWLDIS